VSAVLKRGDCHRRPRGRFAVGHWLSAAGADGRDSVLIALSMPGWAAAISPRVPRAELGPASGLVGTAGSLAAVCGRRWLARSRHHCSCL